MNKRLGLIVFIVFFLTGLSFALKNHLLTKYEEIEVKPLFIGDADDPRGEKTFGSPLDPEGGIVRYVSPKMAGMIHLRFKKKISFDSFSLFFYGDLHSVSSSLAKDFRVYYQDEDGSWQMIDEVRNNTSPVYRFRSPTTISTDAIEIAISQAAFFNTIRCGDLKFFRKQRVGLLEGIKSVIHHQRRSLIAYWFYYLLFFSLLFLPGYVMIDLIEKRKRLKLDPETKLIFSPIFAIIFLFLSTLVYLVADKRVILDLYLIVFFISLILFFYKKLFKELFKSSSLLLFMGLALLIIFLIIAERDYLFNLQYINQYLDQLKPIPMEGYYGYAFDNLFPWGIARMFLHRLSPWAPEAKQFLLGREATAVFNRTPVLPMITTAILNFLGESHFVYQRFLEVLAILYYGAMYLVIKTYFSKRIAKIVLLLMLLHVQLSLWSFNAELYYKYFAIYPILLAVAVFFQQKKPNGILMASLLGLSFLIHPMTLIFSAVILFLYLLRYRISLEFFKRTGAISLILIFLTGGWYLIFNRVKSISGVGGTNLYLSELTNLSGQLAANKLFNLFNLFVPNILEISLVSRGFWLAFLRFSLVANLTPIFFVLLLIYLVKNMKKDYQIFLLGLTPFLIFLIFYLHQYEHHKWYFLLYPFTLPFFFAYVSNRLMKEKRKVKLLAFGSYVVFMFLNLYFISDVFIKMKCASLVVQSLFLMILGVYFSLSVWLLKFVFQTRRR